MTSKGRHTSPRFDTKCAAVQSCCQLRKRKEKKKEEREKSSEEKGEEEVREEQRKERKEGRKERTSVTEPEYCHTNTNPLSSPEARY
jgi:hypothetical protein